MKIHVEQAIPGAEAGKRRYYHVCFSGEITDDIRFEKAKANLTAYMRHFLMELADHDLIHKRDVSFYMEMETDREHLYSIELAKWNIEMDVFLSVSSLVSAPAFRKKVDELSRKYELEVDFVFQEHIEEGRLMDSRVEEGPSAKEVIEALEHANGVRLLKQAIDEAIDEKDEQAFYRLTDQYRDYLKEEA